MSAPETSPAASPAARSRLIGELDALYEKYNRRELVDLDPLAFVLRYVDPDEQEIAGLVASALAYGRVAQIHRSVAAVLGAMGRSPRRFVLSTPPDAIRRRFRGFRHRFTAGHEVAELLAGARRMIAAHGSLQAGFRCGLANGDPTILPALGRFVAGLRAEARAAPGHFPLLPSPADGSACKRLNLYLRWMIRRDDVDPGPWVGIPPSLLVVPLDTHMHRIARGFGLTRRRQADLRTAVEVTSAFREMSPLDPVRYDFALTRMGMEGEGRFGRIRRGA
jgi:uncharacterized protein (TIGR02757 family)